MRYFATTTDLWSSRTSEPYMSLTMLTKKTMGSYFKKSYTEPVATSDLTEQQAFEAELNSYLQGPIADSQTNPLAWWKINSPTYPRVSLLAKRYLCIPATSSPSERAFSTGGNIVPCNRAALKPDSGQISLSGKTSVNFLQNMCTG